MSCLTPFSEDGFFDIRNTFYTEFEGYDGNIIFNEDPVEDFKEEDGIMNHLLLLGDQFIEIQYSSGLISIDLRERFIRVFNSDKTCLIDLPSLTALDLFDLLSGNDDSVNHVLTKCKYTEVFYYSQEDPDLLLRLIDEASNELC